MLITYVPNFKAKRLIQKKILTMYQHVPFRETIVESMSLLQLWHPLKGWKIAYLLWNFCHKIIYILITCLPNFKAKKFIKKRYSKSTNICSCENPFHYCQIWHPPKAIYPCETLFIKCDTIPRLKKIFLPTTHVSRFWIYFFELIFWPWNLAHILST